MIRGGFSIDLAEAADPGLRRRARPSTVAVSAVRDLVGLDFLLLNDAKDVEQYVDLRVTAVLNP